ncbi:MAG: polyphosphate kinase 1 [Eubacteriales bacterium]
MKNTFWQSLRKIPGHLLNRASEQTPKASESGSEQGNPVLPTTELRKGDSIFTAMEKKSLYINRELSWLKFNERVLEEAEREDVPLCERLNFLSIYQSNLDEFFMVRVGSLVDQMLLSRSMTDSKTHMTAEEQIQAVLKEVRKLDSRKGNAYGALLEQLDTHGIRLVDFRKIGKKESESLEEYFDKEIAALLSPSIVGKRQPFPFLRNKEIYAAVVLTGKSGKEKLGIIPCGSNVFPRLIPVPMRQGEYMLSEELILHFIPKVFKDYRVKSKSLIRITRSADIDADALYDEDLDYREFMVEIIKQRRRLSPVRLELSRELDEGIVEALCRYAEVEPHSVFRSSTPLDLSFLFEIQDTLRQIPELFYKKHVPRRSPQFQSGKSILQQIRERDKLLSYPFDSMRPFLDMLREAANDDKVISIKMTLYRVARQSKVVESLIEAAENGKEVQVLVELKARFDEENNIEWSRRLENAGCHVVYGLDGYKVHSKLCLITRLEAGQVEYFTQIGTGNYNEKTARLYTDLSLMTADQSIGLNAAAVFQSLALGEVLDESPTLLVAPRCLQNRILDMIDEEIAHARTGEPAYIGLKINSLTDKTIIDRLITASREGVTIDMVVRGICCLRPGVEGATDHIRIISIVGRFLEHSRIYLFGIGKRQKVYISSADFMTRNTLRRVEVAAPIRDPELRSRLVEMFRLMLQDNQQARELKADGKYVRVRNGEPPINSQEGFCRQAYEQATDEQEGVEVRV